MEEFRDIPGYEGVYQVSNLGRVKSFCRNNELILKPGKTGRDYKTNPYYHVALNGRSFKVHTLVAITFLKHKPNNSNDIVVDHIDDDRSNNKLTNLRLLTNRENLSRYKNKSSKYTGVHYHKRQKKWCANIWVDGSKKYIGSFKCEVNAHLAYQLELNKIEKNDK